MPATNARLVIKAALQIRKSPEEVFEAIVNPDHMRHYFIASSIGRIEEGKTLIWKFPEFIFEAPVRVETVEAPRLIVFNWDGEQGPLTVEIKLEPWQQDTVVRITEKSMENNESGVAWLIGNTEGWANFLACLKAYLEFGINLRTGGFDFRKGEF